MPESEAAKQLKQKKLEKRLSQILGPCYCCGVDCDTTQKVQWHHPGPPSDGTRRRKGTGYISELARVASDERFNEEIKKVRRLCVRCHLLITALEYHPNLTEEVLANAMREAMRGKNNTLKEDKW